MNSCCSKGKWNHPPSSKLEQAGLVVWSPNMSVFKVMVVGKTLESRSSYHACLLHFLHTRQPAWNFSYIPPSVQQGDRLWEQNLLSFVLIYKAFELVYIITVFSEEVRRAELLGRIDVTSVRNKPNYGSDGMQTLPWNSVGTRGTDMSNVPVLESTNKEVYPVLFSLVPFVYRNDWRFGSRNL